MKDFLDKFFDLCREYQEEIQPQKTAEMKARNDKHAEAMRNKPSGMQHMPPLSPEAIARARAQWGITGEYII